jgi:hypothetical protein
MAHPTLPQLVHVPAEGPAAGTEALQSRPAGGASQSAAEAALGLVTVDILGLAGTGVPPVTPPPTLDSRHWNRSLNSVTDVFSPSIYAGDLLLVVGVLAVGAGETNIAIASVTSHWAPSGSEEPLSGSGAWWWQQFLATPTTTTRVVTVTATATAQVIFSNFARFIGRGTVNAPGPSATGSDLRISVPAPSGAIMLDQGRLLSTAIPSVDAGQTVDYDGVLTTGPSRSWFGSHRIGSAAMGWTGQAGAAWMLSAIGVT